MRKLTVDANADAAIALETVLLALEHPAITAISRFENGPNLWRIEAYALDSSATVSIDAAVAAQGLREGAAWLDIPETNWVLHVEKMLSPVSAGRFLVHGPHDRDQAVGHLFAIEIEAGEAFGTAHHGSTEGCLIALSHIVGQLRPRDALDLGTGSGVLAIAIAKLAPEARILASDIDARSVEIAGENAHKNRVGSAVRTLLATGFDHVDLRDEAQFDLIVANILAGPLVTLAPAVTRALRPDGRIVLSGLLDRQAADVMHAYASSGCHLINSVSRGEWVTLVLTTQN